MHKAIHLILILLLSFCKIDNHSAEDKKSILQNLGLLFVRSSKLTIAGTAVKGIIKRGKVTITPLRANGSCDTETVLVSGETDQDGGYSLTYYKTGGVICVTISGQPNESTKMYDEKLKGDITLSSTSDFKLVTVLPESKFVQNNKKNIAVSPLSNMLAKRFQYLVKESAAGTDISQIYKKASKEVVVRFGLNAGLSSLKNSNVLLAQTVSENDYPDLDDISLDFTKPSDPVTTKFISLMAGFSQLANQYKAGSQTSPTDINTVVNAFATDFEDGVFDGVGIDFKSISLGSGSNTVAFTGSPLTGLLLPAVVTYIKEGGTLTVGASSTAPLPTITTAEITSQIQLVDNSPIASAIPNPINRRPFPIPHTGQVKCFWDNAGTWTQDTTCIEPYTEGNLSRPTGQDAHYPNKPLTRSYTGPTASTTFPNDYTTLDNATGLLWKTCVEGKSDSACSTGTPTITDHATAMATCNAYNASNGGSGYAGKTDWHLPTAQELSTIFNYNFVQAGQIDTAKFPGHVTFLEYWSSTTFAGTPANAWVISWHGASANVIKTNNTNFRFRCVSGSIASTQSFTDNTNGTVQDNFTGLLWQKCPRGTSNSDCSGGTLVTSDWVNALGYCEGLTLGGRSDWRLPNINELRSLVDFTRTATPFINVTSFPNSTGFFRWSSTSYIGNPQDRAYYLEFNTGNANFSVRSVAMAVNCVAGP